MKNFQSTVTPSSVVPDPKLESEVWPLPHVDNESKVDDDKTNAFGKKSDWSYEPPEEVEVEEIIPLTAEDIEEIRQAAHEEGFNQGKEEGFTTGFEEGQKTGHEEGFKTGHEEGLSKGLDEGQVTITQLSDDWKSLIEQLHQPMKDVEKNVEEQLLHLVVKLTEAVTHQEVTLNSDILTSAITAGIKALPAQEVETQILLNPNDIKRVEAQFGEAYIKEQGWRLLAAPQLTVGSCQIENSTSNIDLSIKERLKEVLDSFLQDALHA